ncbi:MAG: phosphate acyltransferase PlsX [Gammaproteobacteria bacterium]|nr:phosphate acyltransferase PlsX [Gammaproteobacteria bacterium]
MNNYLTLSLDVMSGENDPDASILGALDLLSSREDIKLILVGDSESIKNKITNADQNRIEIIHTDEIIEMDDSPLDALRKKKNSSMRVAIDLVRDKKAQACISSGNTGALLAISKNSLKTIPTIDRPALMTSIPTKIGFVYILDLGANTLCSAEQLTQFALMGSTVAKEIKNIDKPRVGLLNIGQEEIKGNESIRDASLLISKTSLNYIGFIEPTNIVEDIADVIVTDGFTGNIVIKTMEGTVNLVSDYIREAFGYNFYNKLIGLMAKPVLRRFKTRLDPRHYNGALLLGLNGIVVKSHGGTDSYGFHHALLTAVDEIEKDIVSKLKATF